MIKTSQNKVISITLLIILFFVVIIPLPTSSIELSWWNQSWSHRQQIHIPLDTTKKETLFQPIDQHLTFENPCWTIDEKNHSIRICSFQENKWVELESQIYDLQYTNESYIKSCRIIFLIPSFANGKENYFVYYDEKPKPSITYPDHVSTEESYYHYEPISGYPLESNYYKITDDNEIKYIISQQGRFIGDKTSQHITKMLPNTTEVLPKNGELFASFDFKYYYGNDFSDYSSTSQQLIAKEILIDGTLMVSLTITSLSKKNDLQTTATYTYYHCPTEKTRIRIHVIHKTLEQIQANIEANTDGIFATLQTGGIQSNSIDELNIGKILPYLHIYNDLDQIRTYPIDIDPEYRSKEPDIRIIDFKDDIDLGTIPWISFSEGEQGTAHALIFQTNKIIKSGNNEKDGLQINAYEMDYPHLPGLENNIAAVQVGRNSYEKQTGHDIIIPKDFIAEFNAEFFTSSFNGVNAVKKEAAIFQHLIDNIPNQNSNHSIHHTTKENHNISIFVHGKKSIPMGATFSSLLGKKIPYLSVELYKNNTLLASKTAMRLPIKTMPQNNINMKTIIKNLLTIFDWKNSSFFKKAVFHNVASGTYIIKIYQENPLLHPTRQFIGLSTCQISEDKNIHIYCHPQRTIECIVKDQNKKIVENVHINLLKNNIIITQGITKKDGKLILNAPASNKEYNLQVWYDGFLVRKEPILLRLLNPVTQKRDFELVQFNVSLIILDSWNLPPAVSLSPSVFDTTNRLIRSAEKISASQFMFSNLLEKIYTLSIKYKAFTYHENINVSKNKDIFIQFPANYSTTFTILDSRGLPLPECILRLTRQDKELNIKTKNEKISVTIPPATYNAEIISHGEIISKRNITIHSSSQFELISNKEPIFPIVFIFLVMAIIILFGFIVYNKRKPISKLVLLIPFAFILISLVFPWWTIQGSTSTITTSTNLYLVPSNMITITNSATVTGGEQAFLPELFTLVLTAIIILILAAAILFNILIFGRKLGLKRAMVLRSTTIFLLICVLFSFFIIMNSISEVGVGSFLGQGIITVSIPGESEPANIMCSWGPSTGFYLIVAAIIFCLIDLFSHFIKKIKTITINL